MNKILEQRFLKEKAQHIPKPEEKQIKNNDENAVFQDNSPTVDPEILRQKIKEKLFPKPKIIMSENLDNAKQILELVHFSSLFEFVSWYESNQKEFSENQQKALNSLIDAKNMTLGGCNCDREKRKFIAEDYFRKFWSQNKTTDLPSTLQKILNTKKLLFGDFLVYPE